MTPTAPGEASTAFLVLSVSPVAPLPAPGDSGGTVRVTVVNQGPADAFGVDVGFCQDNISLPFTVSGEIPGGCQAPQEGQYCFDAAGPDFGLGAVPANHSQSCLLRLTAPQPITNPLHFPIVIYGSYADANGAIVVNSNPSIDAAELILALGPQSVPAFGLSQIGIAALIFLLGAFGCYSAGASGRRIASKDITSATRQNKPIPTQPSP
jgi:hypothetical protein